MEGFGDRTMTFRFGGREWSCEVSNEQMMILDGLSDGLSPDMPAPGSSEYGRVHEGVKDAIVRLFGGGAYAELFGGRPESILDDIEVLAALNRCVADFMAERIAAAVSAYDPAGVVRPLQ